MRRFVFFLSTLALAATASARNLTRYAVVMSDAPAAMSAARSDRALLQTERARVRGTHDALKASLRGRGIAVTGEADTLLNAVFVAAGAADLDAIRAMPGVSYVVRLPVFHRDLDAAEQLIDVPAAWSLVGGTGNAGAGVKIGVIDTGIDVTHPAFQDASLVPPTGFPLCGTPSDCAFTNSKVIVARSFVSLLTTGTSANAAESRPDDLSARDRVGHGTAVAMAAAGVTNTGPSDTITGVAPKAFLGNYKVFGSPGINDSSSGDAIILAIEAAYNDGMDIAELSLGGTAIYGPTDTGSICGAPRGSPCDVIAATVQAAATATPSMIVVVAAGNAGADGNVQPSLGTMSSPADAPAAIAVAATTNSHEWSNAITVNGVNYHSQLGNGPVPAATLTGPLSDIANVGDPQGCSAVPAGSLTGTVTLIARGTCTFVVKVQNAETAGAIGVIFTNNPGDDSIITPGGLGGTSIPAALIGYDDGQAIRAYLANHAGAPVSIDPNLSAFSVSTYNQMASFSSRGPVLGSAALKPDIAAAGTDLYLAAERYDPNGDLYSANGYIVSQGTSFSTPQIAGVAALVKQAHPAFTAAQVKAAIMNTATQDVTDNGSVASVLAVGAGKADARAAVAANLVTSPASVSFGVIKAASLPVSQQIQLQNLSTAALNVSVTLNRRTGENNAVTSIDLPSVSIPAGQTGAIHLTLSGNVPSPGIYEGYVTVQSAATSINVPYMYAVGSGTAADLISIAGDGDTGIAGSENSEGGLFFQVLDQFGLPAANVPVTFRAASGGGTVSNSDRATDVYGFAGSNDTLGSTPGVNVFEATAGSLSTTFTIVSATQPAIFPNGALNGASFQLGQPVAPGSIVSLFGSNLSPVTQPFSTPYFPISMQDVSVSFDTPTLSVPGRLIYLSPGQINIQVPWEMQQAVAAQQTAVQVKVSIGGISGAVYNLPLAAYSPGIFESPVGSAAALDLNNELISASNPAAQGKAVQLFVNGLGPVSNQPASGDPASLITQSLTPVTPTVTIGGQSAQVIFSGLAPGYAGLYQVNAIVPATGAGIQPISISIGGVTSKQINLAVK